MALAVCNRIRTIPERSGPNPRGSDPDQDGAPNLLEYALGSAPLDSRSAATTQALVVTDGGVEYPAIQFRRRALTTDLGYSVQTAGTLSEMGDQWTRGNRARSCRGSGMAVVTVRSTAPVSGNTARFFRVMVQSL